MRRTHGFIGEILDMKSTGSKQASDLIYLWVRLREDGLFSAKQEDGEK